MSKKSLIVLSICLLLGAGIVAYVWANGCCDGDPLCHGRNGKIGGTECDYEFEVDLDVDCIKTTTVRLVLTTVGGTTDYYMCQILEDPPYDMCVPLGVRVTLDGSKDYTYCFETLIGCEGRDPDEGVVLLFPDCD